MLANPPEAGDVLLDRMLRMVGEKRSRVAFLEGLVWRCSRRAENDVFYTILT